MKGSNIRMKKQKIHTISVARILLKRIPITLKMKSDYLYNARDAVNVLNKAFDMQALAYEIIAAIFLSQNCKINGISIVAHGAGNVAYLNMADLFKAAILHNAAQIIVAHNHPTGNVSPSPEDFDFTEKLLHAAQVLDIKVADHIIISKNHHYSFKENYHLKGSDPI